ncbi:hypothetical protein [Cellulosimicrobium sp. 22601]|uniref:hypothetical protein n=1 Tax=unclassified Cellulosimicrobium TaxID=2624466 RepID=UPI003F873CFE
MSAKDVPAPILVEAAPRRNVRLFVAGVIAIAIGFIVWALGRIVFKTSRSDPWLPDLDDQVSIWTVTGLMILVGLHLLIVGAVLITKALRPAPRRRVIAPFALVGAVIVISFVCMSAGSTINGWVLEASP